MKCYCCNKEGRLHEVKHRMLCEGCKKLHDEAFTKIKKLILEEMK